VIVVSFNTKDKLRRCLACLEPEHEVIVVDNASHDGSPQMVADEFPGVKLIRNSENVGFGIANNQGCEAATGDAVLFLNSDAYAEPGAVAALAKILTDPAVVAGGGRLLNPDRSPQESIAGPLTLGAVLLEQTYLDRIARRLGGGYWRTSRTHAKAVASGSPVPVEQVMGACLLVRASVGTPLELFDPRFFLYCEDTDLCRRLSRHGTIVYHPTAEFVHDLGSSSAKDPALGIMRYNWGKELYFRIHHGVLQELICLGMNRLGAFLRLLVWAGISVARPARRAMVGVFWRVLTAPHREARASTRTPESPRPAVPPA